jgi:hypothetical protein
MNPEATQMGRIIRTVALLVGIAGLYAAPPLFAADTSGQPPAQRAGDPSTGRLTGAAAAISGVWFQDNQQFGSLQPPRVRIARTVEGKIPELTPWAAGILEKRIKDAENGHYFANTASLCLPQGIPYMFFGAITGPIQILVNPEQEQVTVLSEELNERWLIYMNQTHPPLEDIDPSYHGDSVGHWDGDTLVADTVGLNERTTLDQVGMPHSELLRVITRIHRISDEILEIHFTFEDPKAFVKPWSRAVQYRKAQPGERVNEEICEHEATRMTKEGYQQLLLPSEVEAGEHSDRAAPKAGKPK